MSLLCATLMLVGACVRTPANKLSGLAGSLPAEPTSTASATAYYQRLVNFEAHLVPLPEHGFRISDRRALGMAHLPGPKRSAWQATIAIDIASTEVPRFTQTEIAHVRFGSELKADEVAYGGLDGVSLFLNLAALPTRRRIAFMNKAVELLAASPSASLSTPQAPITIDNALPYDQTYNDPDNGPSSEVGARIKAIGEQNGLDLSDLMLMGVSRGSMPDKEYLLGWFDRAGEWRILATRSVLNRSFFN